MLATWLTVRFDLTVPVVSAPMAGAAGGHLAAAVTAAGGLGMIGVGDATPPDWLRQQAAIAAAGGAAAGGAAAGGLRGGGIQSGGAAYGIGLLGWCGPDRNGQLAAVLGLPAPPVLVSVSYGDPAGDERRLLPALHDAGITVATQVGSREEARRAAAAGFDLLVARGSEGGGHGRDAVATLPLLQEVLDDEVCGQLPVLAAGGIGTSRGLAAVLAAGAAGAWVGTAFLATRESLLPPAAIARLLAAASTDTVYTRAYDRVTRSAGRTSSVAGRCATPSPTPGPAGSPSCWLPTRRAATSWPPAPARTTTGRASTPGRRSGWCTSSALPPTCWQRSREPSTCFGAGQP